MGYEEEKVEGARFQLEKDRQETPGTSHLSPKTAEECLLHTFNVVDSCGPSQEDLHRKKNLSDFPQNLLPSATTPTTLSTLQTQPAYYSFPDSTTGQGTQQVRNGVSPSFMPSYFSWPQSSSMWPPHAGAAVNPKLFFPNQNSNILYPQVPLHGHFLPFCFPPLPPWQMQHFFSAQQVANSHLHLLQGGAERFHPPPPGTEQ